MFPYRNAYPQDKSVAGYSGPIVLILSEGVNMPGIFESTDTRALIRSSIERILGTTKGERVMRPTFGSSLLDMLFEIADDITEKEIKDEIINTLNTEEPRIIVQSVEVNAYPEQNTIKCAISFKYKNTNNDDSLTYAITKK